MSIVNAAGIPFQLMEEAKARLPEFIEKNKKAFDDWFREHGTTAIFSNDAQRFPFGYSVEEKRWVWVAEK